jgi:hypothetical protein
MKTGEPFMLNAASAGGFQFEALEGRKLLSGSVPHVHSAAKSVILPTAPLHLNATAATGTSITLSWQEDDATATARGYKISRWDGKKWKSVGTVRSASTLQFTDKKLKVATYYAYSVRAFNSRGQSDAAFNYELATAAGSPSALKVSAAWDTAVTLSWNVNPAQVTSQDIAQIQSDGSLSYVATVSATTTSYTVSDLLAGASYSFEVIGLGFGGQSDYPALLTNIHSHSPTPVTPGSLISTHVTANSVELAWTDSAKDQTGFELQQFAGAGWTNIAELQSNVFSYAVTGLTQETDYNFRLFAVANGARSQSPAQTGPVHTASVKSLLYPTNISVTTGPTYADISLIDNATNEQAYKIEYSTDAKNWITYKLFSGSPATGPRLYVVSGLSPSTNYYFQISAVNGEETSLNSTVYAKTTALVDPNNTTYHLSTGQTLTFIVTSSTPVWTADGGQIWSETGGFTRYNSDGSVDTTYGTNGTATLWSNAVGYSNNHLPFGNPGHFLTNINVRPDGELVAILELTYKSYGGAYPQYASTLSIDAAGTKISSTNYIPPGGYNTSFLSASDFRFFWTPEGKLIEFEPGNTIGSWYAIGLNADLTVDKTFSAGNIDIPGLSEAGVSGMSQLSNGLLAVTEGSYTTLFNSKLAIQPAGFTPPTHASFINYRNQNSLHFTADSINETGYILRVTHAADQTVTDIAIAPTVGSGSFTLNNFTTSTIGPSDSLELFAVNGSLRSAGATVSHGT